MKTKPRQSGLTLMEQTVVIAIVALLVAVGLPAVRTFLDSFESRGSVKAMISASLASARAIAAREQKYAGIRFQNRYQQDNKGCQYMIFIVQDPEILAWGFRAVDGAEPIKLPDSIGVMDLRINDNDKVDTNVELVAGEDLTDTTTFSILFSPSGKLVIHDVQVRNRDGCYQPKTETDSMDSVFNGYDNIRYHDIGMFVQDDYFPASPPDLGLGPEPSRRSFIIYDKTRFKEVAENKRWTDYLKYLDVIHINPYTGTMIQR